VASEESRLKDLLDDFSLSLVMVDPDNLISLGELLEKVETLAREFEGLDSKEAGLILTGLNKSLEGIILEQVRDKVAAMELIGQGAALLQELERSLGAGVPFKGDLSGFLAGLKAEAGVTLPGLGGQAESTEAVDSAEQAVGPEAAPAAETSPASAEEPVSDFSQDQELFFSFITEALEHIETIEINIVSLEQDPEDKNTINSIFRPFHTIKGVAGFLNLRQIHHLTHQVENLLDDARNERIKVTPALTDLVLDAVDMVKKMIHDLQSSLDNGRPAPADYGEKALIDRIHILQQGEAVKAEEPAVSRYAGQKIGDILVDQGLLSEDELETALQVQEGGRLRRLGEILVERGVISPEGLEEALRLQAEVPDKKLGEILVEAGRAEPAAVSSALKDQENLRERKLGEILIMEKRTGAREVAEALREQKKAPEGGPAAAAHTVKIDTIKLDNLVDLVGELVIAQSLIAANEKIRSLKDQKVVRDLNSMARITSELQRTAMGMRMVPIRQTFQKMIRLVRDLSRKSGKQVELTMSGEETEIDRNMVEAIYDPLIHMIRNSIDHGIEPPDLRAEKGKPIEGRIHLRAFHQGGHVVIEIEDDGQGLNRDKILVKAVERGLVGPEDNLSDAAVYNLIFLPGFSTADKITDVSGRGVGMDVVKKAIDKLSGKVEINSRPDQGSTITIRLPLTLAIIDGMIVQVGQNRYILPTMAIHESFRPQPGDYHTVKGQGEMIKVRDSLLPLIRLNEILGVETSVTDPTKALVVVLENENQRRCVMVDEVLGKQEVVIKNLGQALKNVRTLAGGSILGDGRVGLILDVAGLFEVSQGFSGRSLVRQDETLDEDWGMGPT